MHVIGTSARPDHPLAVVIGAGGLGMAMARRLAVSHRILLADIDGAAAEERAATIRSEGGDVTGVACDSTSLASTAELARAVEERGGFRALLYVAGLSPATGGFHDIMRVNLMGAARVCEALLPLAGQGSAAVLISSLGAAHAQPTREMKAILARASAEDMSQKLEAALGDQASAGISYPYSKWGLNQYARRQAAAWGERGARILTLSPGMIATPMGAREFARSETKRTMFEKSPLKRECTMLEIADLAEFLVSPRASFISGTDILADGGLTATLKEETY
jgi:NAD(P)-dependent dehydrogenase (short-subunit alcohol dehydrogenase family)